MGIIAALKKRYKYLYLQDVLDYYDLVEDFKARKKEQAKRLPRGAAGVVYGKLVHLLDAAFYVKHAWDLVSDTSISNSFIKAELGSLTLQGSVDEEVNAKSDILQRFRSVNIVIEEDELNEFMHIHDKNNEKYPQARLDYVNRYWLQCIQKMMTDDDCDDQSNGSAPIVKEVILNRFEELYRRVLEVEDQLLCTDVQAQTGDAYGDLKNTFENFQRELRQVASEAKRKSAQNLRQLTMHDMFKQ
ncbi:hypothetical protein LOD99_8569 [Oopsacas minuta]|uniref:Uncharacterized protein n=1 Tax=Oopsacas minuta TaxID=111878 RepID=A0AAV7JFR6_9METZ|nr:hypothetical protein LOD99_8569 [Oopsacas minuta]